MPHVSLDGGGLIPDNADQQIKMDGLEVGRVGEMSGEAGAEDKKMQVAGMSATIPTHFFSMHARGGGVLTSLCFDTGRLDAKAGV